MMHLLDIISITRNDYDGICNTIRSSVGLRDVQGVRHIVIDGTETDCVQEVLKSFCYENGICFFGAPPSGIAPAFNFGLRETRGEWIWFLNGRDEVHPGLDPGNLIYILQQTRADVIIFEMEFMQSGKQYRHPPLRDLWPPVYNWIPHPATIIRRKVFEKYGLFDESYRIAMDGEFWFRALGNDVVVDMVSIPVVLYDESGISSSNQRSMAVEVTRILRRYLPAMVRMWLSSGQKIFNALRHFRKLSKTVPK